MENINLKREEIFMYKINTFLQRRKMSESQYGIYMVAVAYILSFALLFIGSDTFYKISTRAAEANNSELEETQEDGSLQQMQYKAMDRNDAQVIEVSNISSWSGQLALAGDTYWLLGHAMNSEEYNLFIQQLSSNMKETQENMTVSIAGNENSGDIITAENSVILDDKEIEPAGIEENQDHLTDSLTETKPTLVYEVTAKEREMLERIVEAEATGEDIVGKILVANVIFNRVNSKHFPDTIEEVIFQENGGEYQFSPIEDKRYWKVKISKDTKEAVQRVLEGEDHSKGALYFMSRSRTRSSSAKWFDNNLKWLFKHGGHEFYKHK